MQSDANIPSEFAKYKSEGQYYREGKVGKVGTLSLRLEQDKSGKTVSMRQSSKVPLFVQRVMYLEESLPSMAYVYLISPSGGILQGDRYAIDVSLAKNAVAHLTTQGATRIYRMKNNYAMQTVNIAVDKQCYLEYIPDQIIPFKGSRFYQKTALKVHDNATAIYSEIIVPGRVASGESFQYDICYLKTVAENQDGKPRMIDTVVLEPKKRDPRAFGVLGIFDVVSSVYILTNTNVTSLKRQINSIKKSGVQCRATILPYNSGVVARMLGNSAEDLKRVIHEIIGISRKTILGASFSGMRKG